MIDTIVTLTSFCMLIGYLVSAGKQIGFKPVPARINQDMRRSRNLEHR
jgi:hypothetical protein